MNSNSVEILTLRGLVLFLSGKLPQSLQNIASALRLDPSHIPAAQLRRRVKDVEKLKDEGNAFFKKAQWLDAIDKYSEALEVYDHTSLVFFYD
jgi:DnaJ homolog subfamily C member 7